MVKASPNPEPSGDDIQSPFLGADGTLSITEDELARRARRSVLNWLALECSPGVSHRVAKRLLDDGRQVGGGRLP